MALIISVNKHHQQDIREMDEALLV